MLDFGFYNMDCLQGMKEFPDNYFDLAVVDPPYGGGLTDNGGCQGWFSKYHQQDPVKDIGGREVRRSVRQVQENPVKRIGGRFDKYGKKIISWDIAPGQEYFEELFRISRNQIIWGGNYFSLPPTRCFLIWRKLSISEAFSMAMCEYAWTSFNDNAKVFEHTPQRDATSGGFHPTEKPIKLYEWILHNYAKEGDTILDTHVGSGSSLIACYNTNHKYVGFEIDEQYYKAAKERIEAATAQTNIFQFLGG